MRMGRTEIVCPDCVVSWHNRPLLEIVTHPIVPRARNSFCRIAKI
jgi:hypothetical protein